MDASASAPSNWPGDHIVAPLARMHAHRPPAHGGQVQTWWAYGGKGMGYAPWAFRAKGGKGGKMRDEHGGRYVPGGYVDPYGEFWP